MNDVQPDDATLQEIEEVKLSVMMMRGELWGDCQGSMPLGNMANIQQTATFTLLVIKRSEEIWQ